VNTPLKRIVAVVEGRVQGVGFRFFTRSMAQHHGLTGWVRNLPDGNVEFEAQGTNDRVDAFLEEIKKGPVLSYISDIRTNELPAEEREAGFVIKF
jgi:acylphosphatase